MKRRVLRFSIFFVMMLVFAIIEDMLAASLSGAILVLETIPIIIFIALVFTLLTELVEEHFEIGRGPLERAIDKTFRYMRKHNIKPTHENVKFHLKKHIKKHIK